MATIPLRVETRLREMLARCVRADDAVTQALLEIYSSTVLNTPYNEFNT